MGPQTHNSIGRIHYLQVGHRVSPRPSLLASAAALLGKIVRHWHERQMIVALSELDDRTLADIGVRRNEIADRVHILTSYSRGDRRAAR